MPSWLKFRHLKWCIFAASVLVLTLIGALVVLFRLTNEDQRNLAAYSTVWAMHACLVIAVASLAMIGPTLYSFLGRRRILTAVAIAIVGYFLCKLAPETNRIYFDEHIYMNIGQVIAHTGKAMSANYARAEYGQYELYEGWVNKQPNGHPYILSWYYRIFGVSEQISHAANRVTTGLAGAALYLAISIAPWELPAGAALAVAALYLLTPLVLWWGNTVAVEPSAAATAVFAFLAACIHARLRDNNDGTGRPASAALLAAAVAFACYFRPESLVVYPMVVLLLWGADKRLAVDTASWAAGALAVALTIPQLLHIWSMHTENWGATDGRRFDVDFIRANFQSNAGYFVTGQWFPIAGTLLFFAGIFWVKKVRPRLLYSTLVWFLGAWGIFIFFYAGGYYYGASSRYAVVSCAPVALFMGIGLTALWSGIKRWPILAGGLVGAAALNWFCAMHYVPTLARESAEARGDIDFIARVAPTLPEGSLILANDPCVWNVYGRNSSQVYTLEGMVRTNLNELCREYPGGIYLHWNFWHNVEKSLEPVARGLVQDCHATIFARGQSQTHQFAILRLDTPEAIAKFGGSPIIPPNIPRLDDALAGMSKK